MIKNIFKSSIFIVLITLFSFASAVAQQGTVVVNQDKQIDALLRVKKEVNTSTSNYKIQVYSGNLPGANKAQLEFKNAFKEWRSTKEFETPNYKIWVGNFKTRLEADRALVKIKREFPDAFPFKPKKG